MSQFSCHATPRHVRVTGANRPDFADETFLCEYNQQTIYDNGPIMMRRFPETRCRYIRLVILDSRSIVSPNQNRIIIAFSEIEVLSRSQNVARGAPVAASPGLSASEDALIRITDGLNYYGSILPIREWMNQLAQRHDLERERPLVAAEINRRYVRQKNTLKWTIWLAGLLAASILFIILIDRMLRQRTIFKTRERIAANLHDELGANLHTIGLFGDLAKQEVHNARADERWSKLVTYIHEVRALTQQAGKTARYCTNMLEAKELHENLAEEMKRTAERLLTDLDHDLSFSDTDILQKLKPRRRIDLFLFYKECLTNIIRHSGATRVETRLCNDKQRIRLTIRDNGTGINKPPPALKRRARLLKGNLTINAPESGGTEVTLRLRPKRFGLGT